MGEPLNTILNVFLFVCVAFALTGLFLPSILSDLRESTDKKKLSKLSRINRSTYPLHEIQVYAEKDDNRLFKKSEIVFWETLDPNRLFTLEERDHWIHLDFKLFTSVICLNNHDLFIFDPKIMDPELEITKFLFRILGTSKVFVMSEAKKESFHRNRFEFYTTPR